MKELNYIRKNLSDEQLKAIIDAAFKHSEELSSGLESGIYEEGEEELQKLNEVLSFNL